MPVQPRHYTTAALEQLRPALTSAPQHVRTLLKETLTLLERAEKFVLPEWGRIFDKEDWSLVTEMQTPARLPYPIVAAEYHCDYANVDNVMQPGEVFSSRRIALMAEREALAEFAPHLDAGLQRGAEGRQGFISMPIAWIDEGKVWVPPPSAMFFDREDPHAVHHFGNLLIISPFGTEMYSYYPEHERDERASRDVADEAIAAGHLLTALGLERSTVTTLPAPAALNKKRAKKGRPPIFEYKVLDIVADLMQRPARSGRPAGTHASPRLHKRRGHLRRLASGRITWVRDTLVGRPGGGRVEKSYEVNR